MGGWLKRNWYLVLHNGVFLAVAVFLVVVSWNVVPIAGVVLAVFFLQRTVVHTLIVLWARDMRDQVIDLRESNRRGSMVFSGQAAVLTALVVTSLFSEIPWLALLPGLALPVRVFVFLKLKKDYEHQQAGEYMHKGKYD